VLHSCEQMTDGFHAFSRASASGLRTAVQPCPASSSSAFSIRKLQVIIRILVVTTYRPITWMRRRENVPVEAPDDTRYLIVKMLEPEVSPVISVQEL
jgi:hypothetical protein